MRLNEEDVANLQSGVKLQTDIANRVRTSEEDIANNSQSVLRTKIAEGDDRRHVRRFNYIIIRGARETGLEMLPAITCWVLLVTKSVMGSRNHQQKQRSLSGRLEE